MLALATVMDSGTDMEGRGRYVLVTPARNEERHIGRTMAAVARQSALPERWVIVDDGSADNTSGVVRDMARRLPFVRLLSRPAGSGRCFGSKVRAFEAGVRELEEVEYDYIGILDADITLGQTYYETVMRRMEREPRLGLAGGVRRYDLDGRKRYRVLSKPWSVCGAVQFFRRQCFEDIGGFMPLKHGSEDALAEIMARMKGWEVRAFQDLVVHHHKRMGSGRGGILRARFREGQADSSLRTHPVYEAAKLLYRMVEKPYVVGSLSRLAGYCAGNPEGCIPEDVAAYHRREQIERLRSLALRSMGLGRRSGPRPGGNRGKA